MDVRADKQYLGKKNWS